MLGITLPAAFITIITYGIVSLLAMGKIEFLVSGTFGLYVVLAGEFMAGLSLKPWRAAMEHCYRESSSWSLQRACRMALQHFENYGRAYDVFALQLHRRDCRYRLPIPNILNTKIFSTLIYSSPCWARTWQESHFRLDGVCATCVNVITLQTDMLGVMVRATDLNKPAAEPSGIATNRVRFYAGDYEWIALRR